MRKLFVVSALVLSVIVSASAQKSDTFDIATFQPPAGWKKVVKEGVVMFNTSDEKKGTFALVTLYKSAASSGTAKGDFDADWREFIAGQMGATGAPDFEPTKFAGGWTVITGGTPFKSQLGQSVAALTTFSGFGTRFSFSSLFNSVDYVPALEAFMGTIDLKPLALPAVRPTGPAAPAGGDASTILGTWGQNLGAHMTYGDPVAAGMAGYSKDQYTFNPGGTYTFVSKTFRMAYDKIILVRENGTYEINGGTLTIKPQKSVIQAWSKLNGGDKFGNLLTSQARKLETVTYRFTKHYFTGIDQTNLVLQADTPTDRDGPFSTFTLFPNAWYYKPISSNNPLIELPR